MKILLTGSSSFTGAWFGRVLAESGHEVYGTLQRPLEDYGPAQQARFAFLEGANVRLLASHPFGHDAFLETMEEGFDVVCLHGAYVHDYKSPDFDVIGAVNANTRNLRQVVDIAKRTGVSRLIATGSVFEEGEGAGEQPLGAASPYGLSKGITWALFRAYCERAGLPSAKFVIPNPFGPHEEPRFCAYLMRSWAKGQIAQVNTPSYIRDNIPVRLLASAYADLVRRAQVDEPLLFSRPSCYVESQGSFAQRFAREIGSRLGLEAPLDFAVQTDFAEPRMRVNTDHIVLDWDEERCWDELAAYYRTSYLEDRRHRC
jgi:nucleoside-diphosphate-sugar epimerase